MELITIILGKELTIIILGTIVSHLLLTSNNKNNNKEYFKTFVG